MFAIIRTGGKQYRVATGDEIVVEKIDGEPGTKVTFDNVLMIKDKDKVLTGKEVEKAKVYGEIVEQFKGEKIIVFKYRPKKRYRRKTGHRQQYTRVKITRITKGTRRTKKDEAVNE